MALGAETEIESVQAAWRKREEATRSFECEIVEENVKGKDARPRREQDFKATLKLTLLVDGDRMRYTRNGTRLPETGDPVNQEYLSVFDGNVSKSLYKLLRDDGTINHEAFVHTRSMHSDVHSLYILPVLAHFKPLSYGSHTLRLERWRFLRREKVGDVECLLFEEPSRVADAEEVLAKRGVDGSMRHRLFWIAPSRDMALVKYTCAYVRTHILESQLDINVGPDGKGGWQPESWKVVFFGDDLGKGEASKYLRASASSRLARIKTNVETKREMFDVKFPIGTEVNDHRSKRAYKIKADGSEEKIVPAGP